MTHVEDRPGETPCICHACNTHNLLQDDATLGFVVMSPGYPYLQVPVSWGSCHSTEAVQQMQRCTYDLLHLGPHAVKGSSRASLFVDVLLEGVHAPRL